MNLDGALAFCISSCVLGVHLVYRSLQRVQYQLSLYCDYDFEVLLTAFLQGRCTPISMRFIQTLTRAIMYPLGYLLEARSPLLYLSHHVRTRDRPRSLGPELLCNEGRAP